MSPDTLFVVGVGAFGFLAGVSVGAIVQYVLAGD